MTTRRKQILGDAKRELRRVKADLDRSSEALGKISEAMFGDETEQLGFAIQALRTIVNSPSGSNLETLRGVALHALEKIGAHRIQRAKFG